MALGTDTEPAAPVRQHEPRALRTCPPSLRSGETVGNEGCRHLLRRARRSPSYCGAQMTTPAPRPPAPQQHVTKRSPQGLYEVEVSKLVEFHKSLKDFNVEFIPRKTGACWTSMP